MSSLDIIPIEDKNGDLNEFIDINFNRPIYWIIYPETFKNTPPFSSSWIILELVGTHPHGLTQRAYCQNVNKQTIIYERSNILEVASFSSNWTPWKCVSTPYDIDTKYLHDGILEVEKIRNEFGEGLYDILGQGYGRHGHASLHLWHGGNGSYFMSILINTNGNVLSRTDYDLKTLDLGTQNFNTCNRIVKVY